MRIVWVDPAHGPTKVELRKVDEMPLGLEKVYGTDVDAELAFRRKNGPVSISDADVEFLRKVGSAPWRNDASVSICVWRRLIENG